jgi:hypothetical protein
VFGRANHGMHLETKSKLLMSCGEWKFHGSVKVPYMKQRALPLVAPTGGLSIRLPAWEGNSVPALPPTGRCRSRSRRQCVAEDLDFNGLLQ